MNNIKVYSCKKIFLTVFFFMVFLCIPSTVLGVDSSPTPTPRFSPGATITICPSGTVGQGGCDYIGGDGVQQAIDAASIGEENNKTNIVINSGTYTRQNFTILNKRKYFAHTRGKFLIIQGKDHVILDGVNSANMSGIAVEEGIVEIKNLTIKGFKDDNDDCFNNDTSVCSRGYGITLLGESKAIITGNIVPLNNVGIFLINDSNGTITSNTITSNRYGILLEHNSKAQIKNNQIKENQNSGIGLIGSSQAKINNNQIARNDDGIYFWHSAQATIKNNVIVNNNDSGIGFINENINVKSLIENNTIVGNSSNGYNQIILFNKANVEVINNIIAKGKRGGIYKANKGDASHTGTLILGYNDVWLNAGGNYVGGITDQTGQNGNISNDPKFVNIESGDFHLQSNSPAIDTGDPTIKDPDGSRADIGAYGGAGACELDPNLSECVIPKPILSCPWQGPANISALPGTGTLKTTSNILVGNGTKLLRSIWRGDQGWSRTVPVVEGELQGENAGPWQGPVNIDTLPGTGNIQTDSNVLINNGTKLLQGIWRDDQGWSRTVPVVDGEPQWNNSSSWQGPSNINSLPGQGSLQGISNVLIGNGTKLLRSIWRGDQVWSRIIPVVDGNPQGENASPWEGPISIETYPGTGTLQASSNVLVGNGAKLLQGIWRGDQGWSRAVPVIDGEPQWSCSEIPSTPPNICSKKAEGDANCDGKINGADYSFWLNRQCTSGCSAVNLVADFNEDQRVDDHDYTIWFNNRQ